MDILGKHTFSENPDLASGDRLTAVHETAAAPTITDDSNSGYYPGYLWIDTSTKIIYTCSDSSVGAASWVNKNSKVDPDYIDLVSKFKFKSIVTTPTSPLPSGEAHFNTIDSKFYLSTTDLDGKSNHQIIVGKMDATSGLYLTITHDQWDQVNDNLSLGPVTSDDGISNPNFVECTADWETNPSSLFVDNDEVTISFTPYKKIEDGNGTTVNGDSIDLGGLLTQPTTIDGDNNSLTLNKLGTTIISNDTSEPNYNSLTLLPNGFSFYRSQVDASTNGNLNIGTNLVLNHNDVLGLSELRLQSNNTQLSDVASGNTITFDNTGMALDSTDHNLKFDPVANTAILTDSNNIGLQEAADYSANYTPLSLTNKTYVDNTIKDKITAFTFDTGTRRDLYTYYNVGANNATLNTGTTNVGLKFKLAQVGSGAATIIAGVGVNVIGKTVTTGLGDTITIERITDNGYGLTGEVYLCS